MSPHVCRIHVTGKNLNLNGNCLSRHSLPVSSTGHNPKANSTYLKELTGKRLYAAYSFNKNCIVTLFNSLFVKKKLLLNIRDALLFSHIVCYDRVKRVRKLNNVIAAFHFT